MSNDYWMTPKWIIDDLKKELGENVYDLTGLTVAAPGTVKALDDIFKIVKPELFSGRYDWLFMNPPYSRGNIEKFLAKGLEMVKTNTVVALIKVGTSTKYWSLIWDYDKQCTKKGIQIRYFPKRVKLTAPKGTKESSPNIETCLVIMKNTG